MTTSHDTCFSILLDHEDLNGLIDIAHFGVDDMVKHKLCKMLIQSLAEFIVERATGHRIRFVRKKPGDLDQAVFSEGGEGVEGVEGGEGIEGQALLTIQRLFTLNEVTEKNHRRNHRGRKLQYKFVWKIG